MKNDDEEMNNFLWNKVDLVETIRLSNVDLKAAKKLVEREDRSRIYYT